MAKLLPLIFLTSLLYGCPDTKIPKAPPKAPEPKLTVNDKKTGDAVVSPPEHLAGTPLAKPLMPAVIR